MKSSRNLYVFAVLMMVAQSASAASNNQEAQFSVPVSQGIANPSFHTALHGQNPAGITYSNTNRVKIIPFWNLSSSGVNHALAGDIIWGNGVVGLGGGVHYVLPGVVSATSTLTATFAAGLSTRMIALGAYGSLGISPSSSLQMKLGAVLFPYAQLRFGYVYHGLLGGTAGHSIGLAVDPSRMVTLALDVGTDATFQRFALSPGLGLHFSKVHLNGGYGFALVGGSVPSPIVGVVAAISIEISRGAVFFANYNTIQLAAAGVMFKL